MKFKILITFLISFLSMGEANVDRKAPEFSLLNQDNERVLLSQFKGKNVVLEWTNHECPFVKRHYETNNMQELQKNYTDQNVVWLSIVSSAPKKQGFINNKQAKELTVQRGAHPSHVLIDENGDVGRLYKAKTTPHMYVIDGSGMLRYNGAIDNLGMTGALFNTDLSKAKNYVRLAMDALLGGSDVLEKETRPYGCSVKY